ncbi:hypothetical protein Cva_00858 [Caedimonas varicaedens]|uniref:Primase C-terminal 2 domain-containing protein n=1 Tax=Caedimonas varicaedens TaxID=1629334 RepID=A0A0K8MCD0_9PROT|nr:hypothetical protein Cva_00858 [Caedimonas varicaedens]
MILPEIRWSYFEHIRDNKPTPYKTDWALFSSKFSQHQTAVEKHTVPAFSMNIYKEKTTRSNESVHSMSGVVLDFDGKSKEAVTLKKAASALNGYSYVGYTTFSHSEEAPRYRLVIPFYEAISPEDYRGRFFPVLKEYLKQKLGSNLEELDEGCPIPSKIYDIPCVREGMTPESIVKTGGFLHPELFITKYHVQQALLNVSADCGYHDWIQVGMAIHAGLGVSEGFELWNEWSSTGSKYAGARDLAQYWKNFKEDKGITLGTLFHKADYHPGETLISLHSVVTGVDSSLSVSDQILQFLKEVGQPCLPREIAFGIGKKTEKEQSNVRVVIKRLYDRGDLARNSTQNTYELSFTKRSEDQKTGQRYIQDDQKSDNEGVTLHENRGVTPVTIHDFDSKNSQMGVTEGKTGVTAKLNMWSNFREYGKFNILDVSHFPILASIYSFFTSNCKPFLPHLALGATINCAGHMMRPIGICRGKRTNFYTLLICRTGGGKETVARNIFKYMDYQKLGAYTASNFVSVQGFEKKITQTNPLLMITDEAAQWFGAFSGRNTSEHFKKLKTALKLVYSGDRYTCQNSKSENGAVIEEPFLNSCFLGTPAIFQNIREDDITDGLLGRMLVFHDVNNSWGISAYDLSKAESFVPPELLNIKAPSSLFELYEKNNRFDLLHFYEGLVNSMPLPDTLPDNYVKFLLARIPENFNKLLLLTMNEKGEVTDTGAQWAASVAIYCYDTACALLEEHFGKTFFSDAHQKMFDLIKSAKTISKSQLRASHAMKRLDKRVFEEALDALAEMGVVEVIQQNPPSGGRPTITINL